jgi:hypothetical protein
MIRHFLAIIFLTLGGLSLFFSVILTFVSPPPLPLSFLMGVIVFLIPAIFFISLGLYSLKFVNWKFELSKVLIAVGGFILFMVESTVVMKNYILPHMGMSSYTYIQIHMPYFNEISFLRGLVIALGMFLLGIKIFLKNSPNKFWK